MPAPTAGRRRDGLRSTSVIRLLAYFRDGQDKDVIAHLLENDDLLELVESIAANGYVDFDPLIVLAHEDGKLTVIEGNRRAAAIKLLRSPDLAAETRFSL